MVLLNANYFCYTALAFMDPHYDLITVEDLTPHVKLGERH